MKIDIRDIFESEKKSLKEAVEAEKVTEQVEEEVEQEEEPEDIPGTPEQELRRSVHSAIRTAALVVFLVLADL